MKITWSHDQWVTWLGGWNAVTLNHEGYSKSNKTKLRKYICITNRGKLVLQIGSKFVLLQIRANFLTNLGSYYKLEQPLLQNRAAITNWVKMYYKLGQVLQIRAIITNWGIAILLMIKDLFYIVVYIRLLILIKT